MRYNRRVLSTGFAGFALLAGCGSMERPSPEPAETVRGLAVRSASVASIPDEIEAPGTLAAAQTAQVASRTLGTVTVVAVREGDVVKAGQTLAGLDERELIARRDSARAALGEAQAAVVEAGQGLKAAEAQAAVAKKTFDRFVYLQEQKSVSAQEFDEVSARHRAAEAQLEQARARQEQVAGVLKRAESEVRAAETLAGYARIAAPFAGVVVKRWVDPGVMAMPGMPLVTVESLSSFRLEVTVGAESAKTLQRGARAKVQFDAIPGKTFAGKVVELEAGADPGSHTVRAKVEIPRDPALRSGLFGRAWFNRGQRNAIVVPPTAIRERGQLHGLYVVDNEGLARWRLVTIRTVAGEGMEVLSGLSAGERYVENPGLQNLDGKRVEGAP